MALTCLKFTLLQCLLCNLWLSDCLSFFWTEMSQAFPGVLIFLWIEKEKMPIWLAAALPRCYNIANVRHDGWKFSLKTELWRNFYLFSVVPPPGGDDRKFAFTLRSFCMVCRSDCRFVYLLSLTWIIVIRIQSYLMVSITLWSLVVLHKEIPYIISFYFSFLWTENQKNSFPLQP